MVVVVMGVAGSGKTTVGRLVAQRLGWRFCDADDLHPEVNRRKMRAGVALTDEDRRPWLDAVRGFVAHCLATQTNAIVACSALRQSYRDRIRVDPANVKFVHLKGSEQLIAQRAGSRKGHFFNPDLMRSQFETLEEPRDAIVEDVTRDPDTIAASIIGRLSLAAV